MEFNFYIIEDPKIFSMMRTNRHLVELSERKASISANTDDPCVADLAADNNPG
jgi:hypothetical protein